MLTRMLDSSPATLRPDSTLIRRRYGSDVAWSALHVLAMMKFSQRRGWYVLLSLIADVGVLAQS